MLRSFRIVVRMPSAPGARRSTRDVDVVVACTPTASGADLWRMLRRQMGTPASSEIGLPLFDGQGPISDDTLLVRRLRDGGELVVGGAAGCAATRPEAAAGRPGAEELRLVVAGGLDAGESHAVDACSLSALTIGRAPSCELRVRDRTVSARHAALSIGADGLSARVTDLGSGNGTFVNERRVVGSAVARPGDVVRVGAVEVELRPAAANDRPIGLAEPTSRGRPDERGIGPASGMVFNRPPRTRATHPRACVDPPKPPPPPVGRAPFRPAAFVIPLLFAALLVAVTRQWMFAIFAAMSPVMMIANAVSDRRANRDRSRRELARFRGELEAFDAQLGALAEQERTQRRDALPDLAEVHRRAALPSRSLWERRPTHDDFLQVRLGTGDPAWDPPLQNPVPPGNVAVAAVLDRHVRLRSTPIAADLRAGRVLGIAGPRAATEALARALVAQVAVHHGPADVRLVFALEAERSRVWDWAKWLPHLADASACERGTAAIGSDAFEALAASPSSADRTTVVVVDASPSTLHEAPAFRGMMGDPKRSVAAIVLAASVDELPATCTTVVHIPGTDDPDAPAALARVEEPISGRMIDELLLNGITDGRARAISRSLTVFVDPERIDAAAAIPEDVSPVALLGLAIETPTPPDHARLAESYGLALAQRWAGLPPDARPTVALGMTERGPLVIDLVRDGPHALIGGTTGSGKSELLRSFVVGLAATCGPEQLTFVLIDYKGGSAFDACARLPHVVGLVTDLDESLSARAVRCLEAELRWREQLLRRAGASDRDSYVTRAHEKDDGEPTALPRLVLVVDEFATLKSELPAFVDALVDVAQRGRSLGVHLVLATQRPGGTVSDLIRANTELKVALRVQDRADSNDVIGSPLAALLPRSRSGMAVVRIGSEDPVTIQTAYTGRPAVRRVDRPVQVRPFRLVEPAGPAIGLARADAVHAATELDVLVDAACRAAEIVGCLPPRRPWPDPLPDAVSLHTAQQLTMPQAAGIVRAALPDDPVVGIMDDPDHQRRLPLCWDRSRGNLLLVGAASAETGAALATIGAALGRAAATPVHVYGLHAGPSPLERLRELPWCGDVIALSDRERVDRLLLDLVAEVQRRQMLDDAARRALPDVVLLVDGLGPLRTEVDDPTVTNGSWDRVQRILAEGPAVHVVSALTIDRPALMTGPIGAVAEQRWIFRLADRIDYSLFGLRGSDIPPMMNLRCFVPTAGLVAQVAEAPDPCALARLGAVAGGAVGGGAVGGGAVGGGAVGGGAVAGRPRRIRVLPRLVTAAELDPLATSLGARPWRLALGTADTTLSAAVVELHAGEHLLVCGPARCGRTTVLAGLVHTIRAAPTIGPAPRIACIAPTRSPLRERLGEFTGADVVLFDGAFDPDALARFLDQTGAPRRPSVLLVDDAELVDDPIGALAALAQSDRGDLVIVASVRTELLRTSYGHWTRHLRRSRTAILFRPTDADAEFAGITVPRRGVPTVPGRGFLARDGRLDVVQFAGPTKTR